MSLDLLKGLGVTIPYKAKYDNFIGGKWVAPVKGEYFDVITPITGKAYTKAARSSAEDIELALDAAHAAADKWAKTAPGERANLLLKIADRLEANLELLATAETIDNGKPIRETLNADIPLAIDHFRYFAGCMRAQEGSLSEIDDSMVAYHFHEPIGVVGQIIPWNFPILMAAWKLAPAVVAGNCVVLKPAEFTPISILILMETIADILPPGVINIVNGYGRDVGAPLANSRRIGKIAFTGSTGTGRVIAQAAASNLIPATLELGGKSPNVFFEDIADADDDFFDKAVEGLVLFAFNQGEVCSANSRLLVEKSIVEQFTELVINQAKKIKLGNPLDPTTTMGPLVDRNQTGRVAEFIASGSDSAKLAHGGSRLTIDGSDCYIEPTVFTNVPLQSSIANDEIFGPVLSILPFETEAEAISIANNSIYGLAASVWTANLGRAHRVSDALHAGTVSVNTVDALGMNIPFGGFKQSGFGRDLSLHALDKYTGLKTTWIRYE